MDRPVEQLVDEILVMDCQSGSVKALEILVSRWQKRLWHYAYNLTGDSEAAWDITQDSWLGIIKGLRKLAQGAAMFGALIIAKLIPDIMDLSIWWLVGLLVLCAIKPFYVFWFEQ
ncbi:MAG: sigma factor [Planctomycetota bacterium]